MLNIFEGKLVRLRAGEPAEGDAFRYWDRVDTDSARTLYEIRFPLPAADDPPAASAAPAAPPPHTGDDFPFVIETLDGVLVGAIHTQHCDPRNGTFSYGLAIFPPYQRKGYASDAVRLVLRFYFHERRYQKCSAEVYSYNPASIRLHERLGFTLEGRLRRMVYSGGAYHDTLMYGITAEEFAQQGLR